MASARAACCASVSFASLKASSTASNAAASSRTAAARAARRLSRGSAHPRPAPFPRRPLALSRFLLAESIFQNLLGLQVVELQIPLRGVHERGLRDHPHQLAA